MAGRLLYSPGEGMSSKLPEEERKEPENKFSSTKTPRKGVLELRPRSFLCIGRLGWKFLVFDRKLPLSLIHREGRHRHIDALPH